MLTPTPGKRSTSPRSILPSKGDLVTWGRRPGPVFTAVLGALYQCDLWGGGGWRPSSCQSSRWLLSACSDDWPPIKSGDTKAVGASQVRGTSYMLSHITAGRIKLCPGGGPWGGCWKLVPPFSQPAPYGLSAFVDFNLYPFSVINCYQGYNRFSGFCEFY